MTTKLVALLLVVNICKSEVVSTLKLIQLVHRHGDRTPIHTYPLDPFRNASYWLDGWGELTPAGKNRMYKVGQFLRRHYAKFLTNSPRDVHIRSSAANRCLESAALILAGLYPPTGRWQWSDQTLGKQWQPFPILTEPRPEDGLLNPGSHCPAAEEELKKIRQSDDVKQYTESKRALLKYVSGNTGLNLKNIIEAEEVFDTLLIERENNYQLPKWVDDDTYNGLKEISDKTFYFDYMSKAIQRLRAGLLIEEIAKHMKEATLPYKPFIESEAKEGENGYTGQKFYLFSTHDTQLAVLLNALGIFNMLAPPFGASIIFEMHQVQNDHIIKIYYMNVTESETLYQLDLPGCKDNKNECHLGQFFNLIQDLVPNNWRRECKLIEEEIYGIKAVVPVYFLGSMMCLMLMVFILMVCIYLNNKPRSIIYQMLPTG